MSLAGRDRQVKTMNQVNMSLRHDYKLPEKVVDIHTSVW
ncbi:hypothetical protein COPEUT_02504 [Coprococcus eutactus ATCC 27759]|nr:hypothetical protein COPEUT_02504 [Coprococcus eutactus ATCC 27759]